MLGHVMNWTPISPRSRSGRGRGVSRRAVLAGLAATALAAVLAPASWTRAQDSPLRIRKNAKLLTPAERQAFVNAVKSLKQTPSPWSDDLGTYDEFVRWHRDAFQGDPMPGHLAPAFFPWHRMLSLLFEQELRKVEPGLTIPYWDWAADREPDAYLWQPDFLGGDGDPADGYVVKSGPFRQGEWTLTVFDPEDTQRSPHLIRAFGTDSDGPDLPSSADEATALAIEAYDGSPWTDTTDPDRSFRRFTENGRGCPRRSGGHAGHGRGHGGTAATAHAAAQVQGAWLAACDRKSGMHNRVHLWVGGQLGDPKDPIRGPMGMGSAPNDPVFWLVHANVDRLWVAWQARHGRLYAPDGEGPAGHNLDDPMAPFDAIGLRVTPRMMLDHHALGYAYDSESGLG